MDSAPRPTVVSLGAIHPALRDVLSADFRLVEFGPLSAADDVPDSLSSATAVIVRGDSTITDRHLVACAGLRVIGRTGAGLDNVDVQAARRCGIEVVYAPGMNVAAVAEMTIGLFLSLGRRLFELRAALASGDWEARDRVSGVELKGAVVGIVGVGRIGRRVAELAQAFGAQVIGYDPPAPDGAFAAAGVRRVSLAQLAAESGFVSLHAPATRETTGIIDAGFLAALSDGAVLVNVARGPLIADLDLLYDALQSGRLGGVGLDVFDPEPCRGEHPIFAHPRCIATPHVAGLSRQAAADTFRVVAQDVRRVLTGTARPLFPAPPVDAE